MRRNWFIGPVWAETKANLIDFSEYHECHYFLSTFVPRILKNWPEKMEKQEQFHQKGKSNGATLTSKQEGANLGRMIWIWTG